MRNIDLLVANASLFSEVSISHDQGQTKREEDTHLSLDDKTSNETN